MGSIAETPEWAALERHASDLRAAHLRRPLRGGSGPGRALRRRGGRSLPRLLQEPPDRRDAAPPGGPGRGGRPAGPHRGDVPRRPHQHDRRPAGPPRGAAGSGGQPHPRRRSRRRAGRPCRPPADGRLQRSRPVGGVGRRDGPADPLDRQHRHRRVGPRAGDGPRRAPLVRRPATSRSASSPTSTARTSSRRPATSTRRRPCSSSAARRSRRSRR